MTACQMAGVLLLMGEAAPARAEEARAYAIEAGPLGAALNSLAVQAGRQILFDPGLVRNLSAPPVKGRMSFDRALRRLIGGQRLRMRRLSNGVVLILREARDSSLETRASAAPEPEIVVTALKRETPLNSAAIAMSVIKGEQTVTERGTDMMSIVRRQAFLATAETGAGQYRLTLRGVYGVGEPTVGVYYDETPVVGPAGTNFDPGGTTPDFELLDVDRIEVLRGPQGTLYGASSMGGTVRVLFNRPDLDRLAGEVVAGFGLVQRGAMNRQAAATLNLPLVAGRAAIRVAAASRHDGGYVDRPWPGRRDSNAVDRESLRLSAGMALDPRTRLDVSFTRQRIGGSDTGPWQEDGEAYRNLGPVITPYSGALDLYNGTARWDGDAVQLLLAASHYNWRIKRQLDYSSVIGQQRDSQEACGRYFAIDVACSPDQLARFGGYVDGRLPAILYQPMKVESESMEFRAASAGEARLQWTVGVFAAWRREAVESFAARADPGTELLAHPLDITGLRTIKAGLSQQAVFGEVQFPSKAKLSVTLGLRLFRTRRESDGFVTIPNIITGTDAIAEGLREATDSGANVKAALIYRPSSGFLAYAQAAQGFRPGGVNITPGLTEAEQHYSSDRLWSYELGVKSPGNDRLRFDATYYHIDWSDMIYAVNSASGAFAYNTNVGAARIDGIETEISARLSQNTRLSLQLNFVHARLAADQKIMSQANGGRKGDRLPNVPRASMSAGIEQSWPVGASGLLTVRTELHYVGSSNSEFNRDFAYFVKVPDRMQLDCTLSLERGRWRIDAGLANILDKEGVTQIFSSRFMAGRVFRIAPRSLNIQMATRF